MAIKIPTVEEIAKKKSYGTVYPANFIGPVPPGAKYAPLPDVKKKKEEKRIEIGR